MKKVKFEEYQEIVINRLNQYQSTYILFKHFCIKELPLENYRDECRARDLFKRYFCDVCYVLDMWRNI